MDDNLIAKTRRDLLGDENVRKQIELKAYHFYLERGQTGGQHHEDWLRAEQAVLEPLMEERIRIAAAGKKPALKKSAKQA